jgi:hypothetical protein
MLAFSMGVLMNPELDILLLDKSSFCGWAEYHYNAVHTLQCFGARKMARVVRRLALSAKEVIIDPETFSVDFFRALGQVLVSKSTGMETLMLI